jgi:manganese/zinc/iron transport system permease protein
MEAAAALGVVFTTLFAVGLLLVRLAADNVHIDPDCVLYGAIETVVLETVGTSGMPRAALVNAAVLAVNLGLVVVFFKELKICAFDPQLATALGIPANVLHYSSMALTAATLVAAFESVGSILVLAMLIAPAAAAHLVTDRLPRMIGLSLLVASLSALGGHALAITVPPVLFPRLGFPSVVDASTAGMTAVVAGMFLVAAILFGPRYGLLVRLVNQARLGMNIAADDILGRLYRSQETVPRAEQQFESPAVGPLLRRLAVLKLWWRGELASPKPAYQLTDLGRRRAESLVRSHRLWESYMAKHFPLPDDHLHESAERAEHFIDGPLRERLAAELDGLDQDPHGRTIPAESPTAQPPNAS